MERNTVLRRRLVWLLSAGIGTVVLWLVFRAYQQPGLLLDLVNLRYCG